MKNNVLIQNVSRAEGTVMHRDALTYALKYIQSQVDL